MLCKYMLRVANLNGPIHCTHLTDVYPKNRDGRNRIIKKKNCFIL